MRDRIIESIIIAVIIGVITFLGNLTTSYFFSEKGIIRVGEPISYDTSTFLNPIDIINFDDKNINKLRISVPENIDIDKVKTNIPVNVTKVTNNLGTQLGSVFEIETIQGKQQISIMLRLDKKIPADDIIIHKNNNNIKVEYPKDIKSPFEDSLLILVLTSLMYIVLTFMVNYRTEKKKFEKINELKGSIDVLKENSEKIEQERNITIEKSQDELNKVKERIDDLNKSNTKRQLLLQSRIKDYSKELNFWKDTVRKLLYESKDKKINAELILNTVTNELKTFQTKCGEGDCFDTVKVMASIISNEDS